MPFDLRILVLPLGQGHVVFMLDFEGRVLSHTETEATGHPWQPEGLEAELLNLLGHRVPGTLVQLHLGGRVLVEPGQGLQHVEDHHVASKLEAELHQGRGHCSYYLELVSENYCIIIFILKLRTNLANTVVGSCSSSAISQLALLYLDDNLYLGYFTKVDNNFAWICLPVWDSGAGAAHEGVEEGEEEDEHQQGRVQVNGQGLVTEVGHVRSQHALVHGVPEGEKGIVISVLHYIQLCIHSIKFRFTLMVLVPPLLDCHRHKNTEKVVNMHSNNLKLKLKIKIRR